MGDANQYSFIKEYANNLEGPYMEVGSKDYGTTQNIRPFLSSGATYIGVDMEAGEGVEGDGGVGLHWLRSSFLQMEYGCK